MPPLPVVPNVVKVRLLYTIQGKLGQGQHFFFAYTGGAPSDANCVTFADFIGTTFVSDLNPLMTADNTLTEVTVEDLSSETGGYGIGTNDEPGSRSGTAIPPDSAVVGSWEIARRYRGGHPRSYYPFGVSDDIDGSTGLWSTSFVSACQTAIDNFYNALAGESAGDTVLSSPVNVSYYKGFTAVENPLTGRYRNVPTLRATPVVDAVSSLIVRSYIGSVRKRRQKTS